LRTLWRLLRYVRPYRTDLLTVLTAMAVAVALDLLRPWPMKILVDEVIGAQDGSAALRRLQALLPGAGHAAGLLAWVSLATVLIFLAGTLVAMMQAAVAVRFGQRMVYDLGADLFLHLQRLSLLFHSHRPVGDTIARVTADPYGVHLLVNGALLPLLQSIVTLVAMFGIMWALDPTLTLLSLGVTPFLVLAIIVFGGPMKRRTRARLDLEGRMMASVQQALTAIPAVQAFTREELEHARFRRYADETARAYQRATIADMWFKLAVGLVTAVGTAVVMWVGGHYALEGRVTAGTVLVFLAYLASLYAPLNTMAYMASTLQHAAANADRVIEILDTPPDVQERSDARDVRLRGHVVYDDVTFGYASGRPVLRHVSLEAHPGEVVAIVGPTGAGKTTLMNLLLRFFDPWSGRILIDGHDIRDLRVRSLRQQVAIVLQEPFIFPLSVAENIAYGRPDARRDEIMAAAIAANAAPFIERLPEGYDTVVGERGTTLSGGEKQRLSIARAFVKAAPILVLDEPTSALDAATEGALLDALGRLMVGRTTFIIAHRLSTIRNADRIVVLREGEIVEQGRHGELLAHGGLYTTLYRTQFGHPQPSPAGGLAPS
jgi:ATP-binding cassette subfamily B protein/subfamily B ATP-binding cassette protein MsbA